MHTLRILLLAVLPLPSICPRTIGLNILDRPGLWKEVVRKTTVNTTFFERARKIQKVIDEVPCKGLADST